MSDAEQVLRKARETLERLDDCEAEFETRNVYRRKRFGVAHSDWGANVPRPQSKGLGEAEVNALVCAAVGKLNAEVEALAKDVGKVTGQLEKSIGDVNAEAMDAHLEFAAKAAAMIGRLEQRVKELEADVGSLRADFSIETARSRGQIIDIPALPLRSRG